MGTESGKADGGQHSPCRSSWWAMTSPRHRYPFHCRPLLSSSVVVRRPLLSILCCCPSSILVRRVLLHGVASLALRLAMGEVDGGERGWFLWVLVVVRGLLRPFRVFVAVVRRSWCCVGRLLSFLDGWDRLRGRGLSDVAWERSGGEADAGCPWAVGQGCGSVVGVVVVR